MAFQAEQAIIPVMPVPSSITRIRLRPPAWISTVTRAAPASSEFSTSSFDYARRPFDDLTGGDLIATCSGKSLIRFMRVEALTRKFHTWDCASGKPNENSAPRPGPLLAEIQP